MKRSLPPLPCACASLRRAARAASALYEEALRPSGLRNSQFTTLQTLSFVGETTQRRLGDILGMDSTTLTRGLAILARKGWVSRERGQDRREWRIHLTPSGQTKLQEATPLWESAQVQMQQRLTPEQWSGLKPWADALAQQLTQPQPPTGEAK